MGYETLHRRRAGIWECVAGEQAFRDMTPVADLKEDDLREKAYVLRSRTDLTEHERGRCPLECFDVIFVGLE